ncbi:condensation domain-containing protein [Streptomyces thinghirensis]|nr:condensation domain-containing protein [Streptomyces thinghirensis]
MLPLVSLTEDELAAIVAATPGGAPNVQDVYPLAALQEGMLFHHLKESGRDPYVLSGVFSFESRSHLDDFVRALRAAVARHDALRTAILTRACRGPSRSWCAAPTSNWRSSRCSRAATPRPRSANSSPGRRRCAWTAPR